MAGKRDPTERRDRGAPPTGASRPAPKNQEIVDEDTPLRIRPDEKTPDPGDDNPVRVPEKEWEANNRRKDTATGLATGDELPE